MNDVLPKDTYPQPNIDWITDRLSGYKKLSFMDAWSSYNNINMDHVEAPKIAFMSNHGNYYYNGMHFRLKNAGATYQRLMDSFFLKNIGRNLEVYVDGIIMKT